MRLLNAADVITPGEILQTDFLEPLDITPYRLAQATGLSQTRISEVMGDDDPQQLMARITGNYRRGNERTAKIHPRNQQR